MKKYFILFLIFITTMVSALEELSVSQIFSQNNNATVYITQSLHFKQEDVKNITLFNEFEDLLETRLLDSYFPLASGTGFFISNDGDLITNQHVIDKTGLRELKDNMKEINTHWLRDFLPKKGFAANEVNIIVSDFNRLIENSAFQYRVKTYDKKEYNASVAASDKKIDLALLKIESSDQFNLIVFDDSDADIVGDSVVAIGYPIQNSIETFLSDFQPTLSTGIISALRSDTWGIQHTASINHGNSGGPLFNNRGRLIGVNVGGMDGANDIYFSIPVAKLITFLEDNGHKDIMAKNNSGYRITESGKLEERGPLETGHSLLIKGKESMEVFLDGQLKGDSPILLENISEGEHDLRMEATDKYHKRTLVVNNTIKSIKEYEPILQYYTGNLFVNTDPLDAEIFIDDIRKGKTPCAISSLNTGSHKILVKHSGYEKFEEIIKVERDRTISLSYSLEELYLLTLEPKPVSGTKILLHKGDTKKEFTHAEDIELLPGQWYLSLNEEHYTDQELMVEIKNQNTVLDITSLFTSSELEFTNLKEGSHVRIDDKDISGDVEAGKYKTQIGEYQITVELDNYLSYKTEIKIEPNKITKIDIDYILLPELKAKKNFEIGIPTAIAGILVTSAGLILSDNHLAVSLTEDYESYNTLKITSYSLTGVGAICTIVGGYFLTSALINQNKGSDNIYYPDKLNNENNFQIEYANGFYLKWSY